MSAEPPDYSNRPSTNLIGAMSRIALTRMEAGTRSFVSGYIPRIERQANRHPVKDAELARDLALHHFDLVAREALSVCRSVSDYEMALWNEIPRFVLFSIQQYPWLRNEEDGDSAALEEISAGLTFHCLRINPWAQIPDEERHHWNVGALSGEAISHAALRWQAEAWKRAAEGVLPTISADATTGDVQLGVQVVDDPVKAERLALWDSCKLVEPMMTVNSLALELGWADGTPVKRWKGNFGAPQPGADAKIERALKKKLMTKGTAPG